MSEIIFTCPNRESARKLWREIADKHAFAYNPEYLNEGTLDALIEFAHRSAAQASPDYPPQHANADGWTDWISPTDIDMYGLQCCDCGLKHEMQFRVMRNKAYTDGEHWFADPVPVEEGYHVAFRMRRDAARASNDNP